MLKKPCNKFLVWNIKRKNVIYIHMKHFSSYIKYINGHCIISLLVPLCGLVQPLPGIQDFLQAVAIVSSIRGSAFAWTWTGVVLSSLIPIFWNHLPLVYTVSMGGRSQFVPQVLTLWVQLDGHVGQMMQARAIGSFSRNVKTRKEASAQSCVMAHINLKKHVSRWSQVCVWDQMQRWQKMSCGPQCSQ